MNKITSDHLARSAVVYVRQSSDHQVRNNVWSREWQYDLKTRARALGWDTATVVEDEGLSGSGTKRPAFDGMLAAISRREVGIILAVDATRLARNGKDWHVLLEFCAVVGCLLADEQSVYDPRLPTDRLMLGMQGVMSELELSNIRRRSLEGRNRKAAQGELFLAVPAGYRRVGKDGVEKDPDLRVQAAIDLVFAKFRELWSVRQVHLWFLDEGLDLPSWPTNQDRVCWKVPNYARVREILTNPIYAGAYAFGRRTTAVELRDGRKHIVRREVPDQADWQVLIVDHHEGYITWDEYQRNRRTITDNSSKHGLNNRGAIRRGAALLPGLLRCGKCGRKLAVGYRGNGGKVIEYRCHSGHINHGEPPCISVSGQPVDEAVGREIVRALHPIGLEASLRAIEHASQARCETLRQIELGLERARYEAERAWRQYDAVDVENRQVAGELERRWNDRLIAVQDLEAALEREHAACAQMNEAEEQACRELGSDLAWAWTHEQVTPDMRKRIARAVLEEIVVEVGEACVTLLLHWKGGDHTEIRVPRRRTGHHRYVTDARTEALIRDLSRQLPDMSIAALLNRLGRRTGKGHSWKESNVRGFRHKRHIPVYREGEREERGELTLSQAAGMLDVNPSKVYRLIREGRLSARQACPGAPWIIAACDVESLWCEPAPETQQPSLFDVRSDMPDVADVDTA